MRVAFLSDIHANFPALCAALGHADGKGAERVVCAGDIVGGGPHPTEVIRLLRERGAEAIRGNVDRKIVRLASKPSKLKRWAKEPGRAPHAWTARSLGKAELDWLVALPPEREFDFENVRVRVVHGSPLGDEDYIFPSLTSRGLAAKLGPDIPQGPPDVLVCGHSHIPFVRTVGGVLVINCGSVGRPVDGDPRGSLVLADFPAGGRATARVERFDYPVESLVTDLRRRKVPGAEPSRYAAGVWG